MLSQVDSDSLDSGIVSPSEKSRNRYFSVSLCNLSKVSSVNEMPGETHQEERLHLVLVPHRHFVDVDDGSVPTARNAAVRLNSTEYRPAMLAITLISREAECDEQRLDRFRPVVFVCLFSQARRGIQDAPEHVSCVIRRELSDAVGRSCRDDKQTNVPNAGMRGKGRIPSSLDVPISRRLIRYALQIVTRNPEVSNLRRESSVCDSTKRTTIIIDGGGRQTFWCRA